tara:strand:+ start:477 stop:668 length:192 start_codon:yes stop_codon:yes gene_type:complete
MKESLIACARENYPELEEATDDNVLIKIICLTSHDFDLLCQSAGISYKEGQDWLERMFQTALV